MLCMATGLVGRGTLWWGDQTIWLAEVLYDGGLVLCPPCLWSPHICILWCLVVLTAFLSNTFHMWPIFFLMFLSGPMSGIGIYIYEDGVDELCFDVHWDSGLFLKRSEVRAHWICFLTSGLNLSVQFAIFSDFQSLILLIPSKAFYWSMNLVPRSWLCPMALSDSCRSAKMACVHPLPFRKPNWALLSRCSALAFVRCSNTFTYIFPTYLSSESQSRCCNLSWCPSPFQLILHTFCQSFATFFSPHDIWNVIVSHSILFLRMLG